MIGGIPRDELPLLPVLHDLLRTRSTTETARRLGCTQSTVSHALARLRRSLGDPLLVRVGRTLAPTRFADELAPRLEEALASLSRVYERSAEEAFDPATLDRAFVFAGTDFSEAMLLPGILRRLGAEAPRVDLVCDVWGSEVEHALQNRDVDLAFGTLFRDRAGIVVKKVAEDDLVLVLRSGHPRASRRLDAKAFAALGHVLVAPRGQPGGAVDVALAELELARRVIVRVRNFNSALALVGQTDLVVSMPRRFALATAAAFGLVVRDLPLRAPRFTFSLAYNVQLARDPAHRWFRGVVEDAVRELYGQG